MKYDSRVVHPKLRWDGQVHLCRVARHSVNLYRNCILVRLRSLRDKGLAAEAITVVPRSGRGAHEKAVWYSSVMIDVARLLRGERIDAARTAHAEVNRLAGHRSARFVAEWLVEHGGPDPNPAVLDAATGGATTIWVRPAFDPQADPNERVPGGPRLLTPAERDRLGRPVTAAS